MVAVTRDELLERLLVERHTPSRPEDVAGYATAVPVDWEDYELVTARRRRVLKDAIADFELGHLWEVG